MTNTKRAPWNRHDTWSMVWLGFGVLGFFLGWEGNYIFAAIILSSIEAAISSVINEIRYGTIGQR